MLHSTGYERERELEKRTEQKRGESERGESERGERENFDPTSAHKLLILIISTVDSTNGHCVFISTILNVCS